MVALPWLDGPSGMPMPTPAPTPWQRPRPSSARRQMLSGCFWGAGPLRTEAPAAAPASRFRSERPLATPPVPLLRSSSGRGFGLSPFFCRLPCLQLPAAAARSPLWPRIMQIGSPADHGAGHGRPEETSKVPAVVRRASACAHCWGGGGQGWRVTVLGMATWLHRGKGEGAVWGNLGGMLS